MQHELSGAISSDQAQQAHADLLDLPLEVWPYEALAPRAWELRRNFTIYDATYVALAEAIRAPLLTLDRQLQRARGIHCAIETP